MPEKTRMVIACGEKTDREGIDKRRININVPRRNEHILGKKEMNS